MTADRFADTIRALRGLPPPEADEIRSIVPVPGGVLRFHDGGLAPTMPCTFVPAEDPRVARLATIGDLAQGPLRGRIRPTGLAPFTAIARRQPDALVPGLRLGVAFLSQAVDHDHDIFGPIRYTVVVTQEGQPRRGSTPVRFVDHPRIPFSAPGWEIPTAFLLSAVEVAA